MNKHEEQLGRGLERLLLQMERVLQLPPTMAVTGQISSFSSMPGLRRRGATYEGDPLRKAGTGSTLAAADASSPPFAGNQG
jgi:hypothetical protein